MAEADAKLRADAQANRDRILRVAREAFATDPETSLNVIAKTAGVGPGTLYRHFPNREALLVGVYHREIGTLVELAPALLAGHPPLQAFRMWCERFVRFGEVKHGLAASLHAAVSAQHLQDSYGPLVRAVRLLMTACRGAHSLRPDVEPEDVLTLLSPLLRVVPDDDGKALIARSLAIIYHGLDIGS